MIRGFTPWSPEEVKYYKDKKWWFDLTWGDILDRNADWYGSRTAIIDEFTSLTWADFREEVDRLAWSLMELGVKKDDCIVVQMANRYEYLQCLLATSRIGAVLLQGLMGHGEREISHFINITGAKAWIVCLDDKKTDLRPMVDSITSKYPSLENVICLGDNIPDGCMDYKKLVKEATPPSNRDFWTAIRPDPCDVYLIGLTGGTTGLPKGVPRTYNDHILDSFGWDKAQQLTCNDVGLVLTPVAHNLAHVCVMYPMFLEGGTIVIANIPNPDKTMEIIEKTKSTFMWCVPTQLARMLDSPNFENYNLDSLQFIGSGGSHVPAELVQRVQEQIGCDFVNGFGMIEGPCTVTPRYDTFDAKCNTVGPPVCPYNEFKIIDDDGNILPPNTDGEMVVKGPTVFRGYFKQDNTTVYTPDGFFRTGDIARIDDESRVIITGRKKDIIIRGGENISAKEVEEVLVTHPNVSDAAVVGMPDKDLGEKVCAFVELSNPQEGFTLDECKELMAKEGVAKFQWPERIEVIDNIPLTNVGKPDKKLMKQMITDKLESEGVS